MEAHSDGTPEEHEKAVTREWLEQRRKRNVYGFSPGEYPDHGSLIDSSDDRYFKGHIDQRQRDDDKAFTDAHLEIYGSDLAAAGNSDPADRVSFGETIDERRIRAMTKIVKMVTLDMPEEPPHKRRGMPKNADPERWNQELIMAFSKDENYPRGDGDIWIEPSDETLQSPTFQKIAQDIIDAELPEKMEHDLALIAMLYHRDGIKPEMMIQFNERKRRNQIRFMFAPEE